MGKVAGTVWAVTSSVAVIDDDGLLKFVKLAFPLCDLVLADGENLGVAVLELPCLLVNDLNQLSRLHGQLLRVQSCLVSLQLHAMQVAA